MRRLWPILAVLFWCAPAAAYEEHVAFEEEPTLSVIVEPGDVFSGAAYVQGEIVVTIRVASLSPFEALEVDVPRIEGATVETLVKPRMREVSVYGGRGFVLERVIAIYPEASGTLVIPPVRAAGRVEPEPGKPLDFADESAEIRIEVSGIDPRYDAPWWMVSRHVTVEETWSKPVTELREGDVVRREIRVTATGVPHTGIQLPEHGRTRGIEFSEAGESGRTEKTAEGVIGTITKAWDLKIGIGRTLYVAPVGISYWHPGERAQKKVSVRGYRIEPLPPDTAAMAARLMGEAAARHDGARLLGLVAIGVLAAPFAVILLGWLWTLLPTVTDRRLSSECKAARTPAELYRAARSWAAASGIAMEDAGLTDGEHVSALLDRLFGTGTGHVDASGLAREIRAFGRRRRVRGFGESVRSVASRLIGRKVHLGTACPFAAPVTGR